MILTAADEVDLIRQAGEITGRVLAHLSEMVAPGVTTGQLDRTAEELMRSFGALPTFKGYRNYPACICTSINEEVVHGIPSADRVLKEGDIISIDLGCTLRRVVAGSQRDYIGDSAVTVPVGEIAQRTARLIEATRSALYAAVAVCRAGTTLDTIGGSIEDIARAAGLGIVREYGGHGIGYGYHEDPFILNFRSGSRMKLKPGMVIAIEPMFNLGGDRVRLKPDGWTVVTQDYKPSVHFEHSLLITEGDPEILTKRPNEVIS